MATVFGFGIDSGIVMISGNALDAMPGGPIGFLYTLMLHGWRPPRVGMVMFFLSIPSYRCRARLVADKLAHRLRR